MARPDYAGELRQVSMIDLGHEDPTIILTNNFTISCPALVTRYAQRMLIENGISEAIQFLPSRRFIVDGWNEG